jgi:hypothetical protein
MWNDKNYGRGCIKGHTVPTVAFCLMKKNGMKERKTDRKDSIKEKAQKREAEGNGKETVSFLD